MAKEQRREVRAEAAAVGLVYVYRVTDTANLYLGPSLLIDTSPSGVSIQLDFAIRPGVVVALKNDHVRLTGAVKNCRRNGAGFRVGLELLTPTNRATSQPLTK